MDHVKSTSGQVVDIAAVEEWVGLHYLKNFSAEGDRKQEWVDRYLEAHPDLSNQYMEAENWVHCFVGSKETNVRWVCSIDGQGDVKVVAGQCSNGRGGWEDMSVSEMRDVQESIIDNNLVEEFSDFGLQMTSSLPEWALAAEEVALTERPSARG